MKRMFYPKEQIELSYSPTYSSSPILSLHLPINSQPFFQFPYFIKFKFIRL